MTADKGGPYESSAPDQYMERHVTDLRVTVGRFDERINDIRGTMVTKEDLAKSKLEIAWRLLQFLVPILAACLGALAVAYLS